MAYRSINPYSGEELSSYPFISDNELEISAERSYESYVLWKKVSLSDRAQLLSRLAEVLDENTDKYAVIITSEMGKPIAQARAEVKKCAHACRYYALNGLSMLAEKRIDNDNGNSYLRFDPMGIVLAVMPWNFPFWQVIRCIAPAMLAGNAVLLKHASNVPGCAMAIADAVSKAGFPEGIFMNLFINYSQVEYLLSYHGVRSVSLTGSNYAGEKVASVAGANIRKCVLELGGSDPFIVFPDADLDLAVENAVTGRFQNTGQSCIATKRIYLHKDIYRRFLEAFIKEVEALSMGNPMLDSTFIGPMVNRKSAEELSGQVQKSIDAGAEIVTGTGIPEGSGCFFRPVVLINAPDNSPMAVEETFGPAVPVFSFSGYDELINRVNSSRFGLGASVWTSDSELAGRLAGDIESGTISINGYTRSDPSLPFGGIKDSGFGRELSEYGLYEFVNIKTVSRF